MVEAMAALVLVDHLLQQQAQCMLMGRDVAPELLYGNMPTLFSADVSDPCLPSAAMARAARLIAGRPLRFASQPARR